MRSWVIVVAAGSGARFGGPKQFERLGATSVLARSVATAAAGADGVVVVGAPDLLVRTREEVARVAPGAVVVATEQGHRVLGDPRRTPPSLLPRMVRDAEGKILSLRAFWEMEQIRFEPAPT